MAKKRNITLTLPESIYQELRRIAEQHMRSMSGFVAWLIKKYIDERRDER